MFTKGEFTSDNVTYGAIVNHTKTYVEALLYVSGTLVSAYKSDSTGSYSFNNVKAKELVVLLQSGTKSCTSKNCTPAPFALGAMNQHEFIKSKVEYLMQMHKGEIVGAYIQSSKNKVELSYIENFPIPKDIQYIKLTEIRKDLDVVEDDLDAIQTRSVQEIALEKEDITWLRNKKYFVVKDDETADQIFTFLDNYNGPIAYDTETSGLKINVFGQINSKYQKDLQKYNSEHSDNPIRADKLVGIIFCVEEDTSYYFPCFNRKFKNLYQDPNSQVRKRIIQNTKMEYTMGSLRDRKDCVAEYWRITPELEITPDCILMERVRKILETKHIVAHNGSFEYKVGLQYMIDTNLRDDTMLMHQLVYKFRNGGGKPEPSNLKYLSKHELGVDQWELHDFFPNWKPDKEGLVRRKPGTKNKGTQIDFSYMDEEGTRVYAPTDGDCTLGLYHKFKNDILQNHKDQEYLYNIEVIVACAIGYMEFYGHRIDESKIMRARVETMANKIEYESQLRQLIEYANEEELDAYNRLRSFRESDENKALSDDDYEKKLSELIKRLEDSIAHNEQKQVNLGSSQQVCDLFYNKLKIPFNGEKQSVAKNEIKALLKEKNDDGTPKYPVVHLYSKHKNEETLLSKFFDNLIYFTYPGGFIFSSFTQMVNTGRMSCIEENTPIKVVGGDKAIKDIQVGDLVYCYDENNNLKIRKVKRVIDNGYKECIKLHWRSQGTHEYGELVCTPDHKILTKDSGWLEAKDTINKDVLSLHSEDNESCNLSKIENYEKVGIKHVYDLEVEEHHNFIANEICVHNCKAPNCQQYPKVITKIIIPRDGHVMMDADYSQIEYRVLTALAGNDGLAKLFADPDSDYHTLMASLMYGVDYAAVTSVMRSAAKSFNFGIPYGMGLGSLAILLTGKNTPQTRDEAAAKMEDYFKNQPKTRKFFDNVKEMAQINGYTKTLFNRYRYYSFTMPDGTVNNGKRAAALRQAGNAVIQGCLDGDTLIETKDFGIVKIKDAVGYSGDIWNGTEWTRGDVLYSGKKQKCIITFRNGQKFICSPIHKFLVGDDAKDINCYVECKDLTNEMSVKCNTKSNLTLFFKSANKLINSNDLEIAVKVESVEITNEWIDMYDVCNTDCGYYVADGIITHNTAADIFKIGVARNFQFIRKNNLLGKLLIINMVHDEQLIEVDVQDLNMQRVLAEVGHNMQLKIEGFPPLYIGAGIGKAWGYAKGKMAEIHPNLLNQLTEEAKQIPLWRTEEDKQKNGYIEPNKVVEYFDSRVLDFRRQKVIDYLTDQTNWNKVMHPAIGGLINLQFNYGRGDDAKAYVGPNGERYSDQEFLELNLSDFIKENNLDVDVKWFRANENMEETKEADDVEYNDGDEDEFDELAELSETADKKTFKIIHDDDTVFGSSIHDIINTFKVCELIPQKMLGIHTKDMYFKRKDLLIETLLNFVCDKEDENALQIVFLTDTNTLNYTGVYVKNVDMDLIEKAYFATSFKEMDFTKGDVKTRSQAK